MPTFNVTAPTGETYRVNAPEGATEAQAIAYAQSQHAPAAAPAPAPRPAAVPVATAPGPSAGYTRARALADKGNQGGVGSAHFGDAVSWGHGAQVAGFLDSLGQRIILGMEGGHAINPAENYTPDEAYAASRDSFKARLARESQNHPVMAPVSSLAGAVMAPGMAEGGAWAAGGKTLAKIAARSAAVGATAGAVYGHGADGNSGIVPGAIAGGVIGAVAPPAIAVAGKALAPVVAAGRRALSPVIDPLATRIASAMGRTAAPPAAAAPAAFAKPEVRAAQAIQNAIDRDTAAGHVIDPTRPLRLAGGENVAALYDVVAQSPGPGRQLLKNAIDAHARETSAAIRSDIGASLGGKGDYFATQDALGKARAANAKPDLEAAFAEPIGTGAFDEHLGPLMNRLPKGAMAAAKDLARMDGEPEVERGLVMLDSYAGHATPDAPIAEKVAAGDLKAVASGARPKLAQGPSLLHFISKNGGLHDDGGELAALDVGAWHKGGPFRSKLIRPDGLSLDKMAEKADAAGYFPNAQRGGIDASTSDNYNVVTGDDLHRAIQDELSGRPTFSREPSFDAVSRTNHLDNLEERIRRAGLTAQGMTPKDAGAALGQDAAEQARLEAHAGGPNVGMSQNVQADAYTPTLKVMHYLKKGIDQTLEPYRNDVTRQLDLSGAPDAQSQSRVRTALGQAMRKVSPAYDKAMQSWGDDSDGINALKLGRNVFSPKFDMQSENLGTVHAAMSDEAKAQYQKGVGEAIIAKVRQSGDIKSVRQLLGDHADEFRARVALAFQDDPNAFGQFIERMHGRATDAARDASIMGGPATYRRAAARADLEDGGTHPLDVADAVLGHGPVVLTGKALRAVLKMVPRKARSAIMDPTANAALGRSSDSPAEVERLLNMLRTSRRLTGAPKLAARAAPVLAAQR